jgi:hypothetical protein
MSAYLSKKTSSEWIRYKDGLWIPYRKRTYLYWFKFLQEAEQSPDYEVDWKRYRGWGGSNVVVGQKFDMWWDDRWKNLFAVKTKGADRSKLKFPLSTTQPKTEAIRLALLIYQHRNTPPDMTPRVLVIRGEDGSQTRKLSPRRGGRTLAIARKVIALEKRKATPLWGINPDSDSRDGIIEQEVQSKVGRYMRNAKKILGNVCEGHFP